MYKYYNSASQVSKSIALNYNIENKKLYELALSVKIYISTRDSSYLVE